MEKEETKGTGERRNRKERRTDTRKHKDTQMKTDAHRWTRIERKIYRQIGR